MAKNMTRKGLAFGAGIALVASGVAAAPATAVVSDADVSLLPNAGTEYGMVLDNVFDLKTDQSLDAVSGSGKLKFLVTDPDKEVLFDFDANTAASSDTLLTAAVATTGGADVSGIAVTNSSTTDTVVISFDAAHGISAGDIIKVSGLAGTSDGSTAWTTAQAGLINGLHEVSEVVGSTGTGGTYTVSFVTGDVASGNLSSATATTLNVSELTADDALDSQEALAAAATLGHAAVTGLTAPTRETDGSFVVNGNVDDAAKTEVLRLVSTSTDTHSVTVTAWIDENGNGEIDSTEDSSSTRTVTFYKWADSGYTLTPNIAAGSGTWKATITFNSSINAAQITDGRLTIGAGRVATGAIQDAAGTTTVSSGAFTAGEAAQWNSTKKYWELEDGSATVGAAFTYGAIANVSTASAAAAKLDLVAGATATANDTFILTDTDNPYAGFAVGDVIATTGLKDADTIVPDGNYTVTAVEAGKLTFVGVVAGLTADDGPDNTTAGALVVSTFTTGVTYAMQILVDGTPLGSPVYKTLASADSDTVGAPTPDLGYNVKAGSDYLIRTKTTTPVTITSAITKGGDEVGAGVAATVKVTRNSLDATVGAVSTITAGGKTLTAATTDGYIEFDATTNSDGEIVFDLTNSKGTAGDSVSITVTQSGITSASKTFVWGDTTAASTVLGVDYDKVSITKGGSVTLNFTVVDDFGMPLAGNYRLLVSYYDKVGGTAKAGQALVTNGSATFSVADVSTSTGSYTIGTTLQKLSDALAWGNYGSPETTSTTVYVVNDVTPTAVTAVATVDTDSGTAAAVETVAGKAVDARYDANAALAAVPAYSADEEYTIAGLVTGANGQSISAAKVVLSGADLLFKIGNQYTVGSIETVADASGNYSGVEVRSNKSGKHTLTVTSGGASKAITLTFDAPLETAGTVVSLADTASSAASGSTFQVVAKVTDKYGNAVDTSASKMSVKYTGPGLTIPSTLPNETDEDGLVKFAVLLGSNDSGTATVTVTYAGKNGTIAETTANDDITVTKTIVIGTAGNTGAFSSWTKKLDDNSAKMYAKNVVGEGKVQFFLNGEEIAWVRAVDATDPKLRTANGSAYLVRTVEFEDGKNVLEIYVDGVRTTRTAYTK